MKNKMKYLPPKDSLKEIMGEYGFDLNFIGIITEIEHDKLEEYLQSKTDNLPLEQRQSIGSKASIIRSFKYI